MADDKTKSKLVKMAFQPAIDKLKDLGLISSNRTCKFVVNVNDGGVSNVEELINHR